ncbi:uncharacterized protein LOC5571616 [Aedes aegypti]|uniref:Uncharacterized protein n=1 Tax=Aedes aegypti TaxID=7159 RepID=A0A1S4FLM0_AEDAE|nr:uncharacterized protein LOC5571616 [Aedes aegypti]
MNNWLYIALNLFAILHVLLAAPSNNIRKRITLEDRYDYIVLGSDHVARSLGSHLARTYYSKSVLVLQSNQCDQILEPAQVPHAFGLRISDTFAECSHLMGYEFTDPLRQGQRVGIGYKNRTRSLDTGQQTLWAIDPNLVLLSGATIARLLYNNAASSVHGVELDFDGSKQCIFAENEVFIAGRCLNDYRHLSRGSMITEMALESLRKLPLEVSLGSPVMVPIFYTKTNMSLKDSPTLLGTEMYLKTPGSDDEDRMKPNARLRVVMGNANLDGFVWVGFVPSLIWDDPSYSPGHEETVKILQHVLKTAIAITECDAFRRLNMMMLDQRISECVKFVGTGHYWTCYLDVKLRRFRLSNSTGNYKSTIFENDFRLKGVKSLRLLPFGLTAPFLDRQWRKLFPEHV